MKQAELEMQAARIRSENELLILKKQHESECLEEAQKDSLELDTAKKLSEIEGAKFKKTMEALGRETIVQMARAGPETQAKLLKGLGLKGYMIMDSNNPLNLFATAQGFMGGGTLKQ